MTLKRLNTCKWFGLFLLFCLTTAIIACRVLIVPPPEGSTSAETTGAVDYTSTTRFKSDFMTSAQHSRRTSAKHDDWASTSVTPAMPLPTFTAITTNGTATASTTAAKSSVTRKTTITETIMTSAKTTPTKQGRPFTRANLVAMINEERARIGNNVRVLYGDAILQKIADIRAEEQLRLFGHRRPMPCPGCDYCYGEKECISNENFWISATYGEEYAAGGWCGGFVDLWTVEDFLEHVKTSPGHYNQMFNATWTTCAYGISSENLYMYISYGR